MSEPASRSAPSYHVATAPSPGAIGIIQLRGSREELNQVLRRLVGSSVPVTAGRVRFGDIDDGVVVAVDEQTCQLMPHGGVRVMQRLAKQLQDLGVEAGAVTERDRDPIPELAQSLFPEAASPLEADMLLCLAQAASPAAADLLIDQPRLWREALAEVDGPWQSQRIRERSCQLDRLIRPPTVVLVGAANVGKSTLSNEILGRSASLTADLPGTTRDWVGSLAQVRTPLGLVAVHWIDTPGYRTRASESEAAAWDLARPLIRQADALVLVGDCEQGWLDPVPADPRPHIAVLNKCDLKTAPQVEAVLRQSPVDTAVAVSATCGQGLEQLGAAIGIALGLGEIDPHLPWAFSAALRVLVETDDRVGLAAYVGVAT
ncbi:MAG: 50S ribosome-binding GTPase [Phycisphaerae bacterium]|nr:50S ribosome-binding GTPase [Phycisphaerae bacterium]